MFQFWNDLTRKSDKHQSKCNQDMETESNTMVRTCSMASDSSSSPSNWSIDWSQSNRTLSFKEDYVSFPSLEPAPANNQVSC